MANSSSATICNTDAASCFPGSAVLTTPTGRLPMHKLRLGDQVPGKGLVSAPAVSGMC